LLLLLLLQWGGSLVFRARLPAATAAEAGVHLTDHSIFVQDAGRFLFAYPISSGDVVWTVGISGDVLCCLAGPFDCQHCNA
jgi:hypothetical protein